MVLKTEDILVDRQIQPFLYHLIGCASGLAGVSTDCGNGPITIQNSAYLSHFLQHQIELHWDAMLKPHDLSLNLESLSKLYELLALQVAESIRKKNPLTIIGGDHSCAIGTWSGVHEAMQAKGDIGLIWIDAHMDSHTPETSETGRIHGMPLAALLGYGDSRLTAILNTTPKFKAENICLIGTRSYELGEANLLQQLKARIYFMDEVKQRGFETILAEAIAHVSQNTIGYGISLDLDAIDPRDAPGVDVPEPNGISARELCNGLSACASDPNLIATEIVEFDPSLDKNHLTEKLLIEILNIFAQGKKQNAIADLTI